MKIKRNQGGQSMTFLIQGIILCIVFTLIVIPPTLKNPLQQLFNYPPKIQERVKSLPEYKDRIPTNKKKLSLKITAAVLIAIILAAIAYFSGAKTFVAAIIYTYGLWMVVNWFDTFVLDVIVFCHVKRFRLPGTEDMVREYESPWFHIIMGIRGSIIGIVISTVAAGLIGLIS